MTTMNIINTKTNEQVDYLVRIVGELYAMMIKNARSQEPKAHKWRLAS